MVSALQSLGARYAMHEMSIPQGKGWKYQFHKARAWLWRSSLY
jgi:hypothetical protein